MAKYDLDEIFEVAKKTAEKSPCRFKVSCILVDNRGRIVSRGYNHNAINGTKMGRFTVHAEADAIIGKGIKKNAGNLVAFIYRFNSNPINCCPSCMALLKAYNVKTIYCMNIDGWYLEE